MEQNHASPAQQLQPAASIPATKATKPHRTRNRAQYVALQRAYAIQVLRTVAYPSIIAFCILSAYAFYLIYSLATDIHQMSAVITDMNSKMGTKMATVTHQLQTSQNNLQAMTHTLEAIKNHTTGIQGNIQAMQDNVQQMDNSTQNMAASAYNLQYGVNRINHNTSPP